MALPSSGNSISLNQMHVEVGGSSGSQVSINDADIRGLISKGSAVQMAFSEWFGASASVADFATTMTVGHTNHTSTIGYSTFGNAAKGFLTTSGSQPMFGTSTNNMGSLSSTSNANYFGGNVIHGLAMLGSVTPTAGTTGTIHLYVASLNISNSDTSFKSVVINGYTLQRSAANYSSTTHNGFAHSTWNWTNIPADLSNASGTISGLSTSSMGPFPPANNNITVTFKRN